MKSLVQGDRRRRRFARTSAGERAARAPGSRRDDPDSCRKSATIELGKIDLEVAAGEIHGLAGLIGSGRTEILETIFGLRQGRKAARLRSTARPGRRDEPAQTTINNGVALVPEDRHAQGLVLDHSIERNITLPRLTLSRALELDAIRSR